MKKIPMRKCVVTNERYPKNELVRIVRTPEGNIIIDQSGKANGRGAYLKKSEEVFNKAKLSKALNRALETNVPDEIYDELLSLL